MKNQLFPGGSWRKTDPTVGFAPKFCAKWYGRELVNFHTDYFHNFRPNIVVEGTEGGFCEDHWLYIKINGTAFRNSKGCTRCVYTTVNPDIGTKEKDGEPLKTLKSFRY